MLKPTPAQTKEIDDIETAFLEGNISFLKNRHCPICGSGRLLFSVSDHLVDSSAKAGRRFKGSINMYCRGECNTMLTHANAYIPEWAEGKQNWEAFSDSLYD